MLKLADNLKLPVELVTQAIGILAKRRAGKSYTARRLTEQLLHARQQVVIADPKGDWWGIRSSADGKSPGLPVVILGGERGDVPLEAGGGEVVAKLVVEERVSVLLDLSLLRKHEVSTFMGAFLEDLYRLKAREIYRTPLMLVIDEADAIAPQDPFKGEERMLGAAEDIVRRGGQRGIGCTMITQRSAVLNKNVLTQIQMLVALRTIAPQDLKAIKAWIDVHGTVEQGKTMIDSLPSLPIGDAWFWSPGWPTTDGIFARAHVLPIETFDSGATPKPGEKRREPKNLADVDLDALKRQMTETIERAKADDPKELRKKIAALESQVYKSAKAVQSGSPKGAVPDQAAIDRAVANALKSREAEWLAHFRQLERKVSQAGKVLSQIAGMAGGTDLSVPAPLPQPPNFCGHNKSTSKDVNDIVTSRLNPLAPKVKTPPRETSNGAAGGLSRLQRALLTTLAQEGKELGKGRLLALAGYRASGDVSSCFADMVREGWAEAPASGTLRITELGRRVLGPYEPLPRGEELRQLRLQHAGLSAFERKALEQLFAAYPDSLAKGKILELTGYKASGDISSSFAKLAQMGWAQKVGAGQLRAADLFFTD
jgi:hypothetical protein